MRHLSFDGRGVWIGKTRTYFDFNDWWIGYYRGQTHHYICLVPTLVFRWCRK